MKTRTRLAVAALAAAGVAAAAVAPLPAVAGDAGAIVIALEAPLTGSQSANGKDMLRGAQLAASQVNARGGVLGRKVKQRLGEQFAQWVADDQLARVVRPLPFP